jgi:hypothetical protein
MKLQVYALTKTGSQAIKWEVQNSESATHYFRDLLSEVMFLISSVDNVLAQHNSHVKDQEMYLVPARISVWTRKIPFW